MKAFKFLALTVFIFLTGEVFGQIKFSEIGVGASYWTRFYNTPSEESVLINGSQEIGKANSVFLPTFHAKVALNESFFLKGRVGISQENYKSTLELTGLTRQEELNQLIVPASFNIEFKREIGFSRKYRSNSTKPENSSSSPKEESSENGLNKSSNYSKSSSINFLAGIGLTRFFIQHDITRVVIGGTGSIPTTRFSGNDYGLFAYVGLAMMLSEKITINPFVQYNTGSYDHRFYEDNQMEVYETENISLNGLELGISLGFLIK